MSKYELDFFVSWEELHDSETGTSVDFNSAEVQTGSMTIGNMRKEIGMITIPALH